MTGIHDLKPAPRNSTLKRLTQDQVEAIDSTGGDADP